MWVLYGRTFETNFSLFCRLYLTDPYTVPFMLGSHVDWEKQNGIDDETFLPFM